MTAIDPAPALRPDNPDAADDPPGASSPRIGRAGIAALAAILVALTLFAFEPVADCGFVNFDDPQYVSDNAIVQRGLTWAGVGWAFTTGTLANYHPLTWLSLMLDRTLWGGGAMGFHLTNIALHAANTVLLLLVLRRMTKSTWRSLLVAALFAVHPLRVESVAWVSARKDCLAAFFGLLALSAYARYVVRPSAARYAAVACLFAASLLCKAMFVTLPAVLLLLDHWPLRRARPWRALVMEKLPLLGIALAAGAATFIAQRAGGAVGTTDRYPLPQRAANAVVAYLSYLVRSIAPTDLSVFYPHPRALQLAMLTLALTVLVTITLLAISRRRRSPWMLVGWLWFLGTFVPMIGLIQLGGQATADRYTYLPMIGLLIGVVWSLPTMRRSVAAVSVVLVMTLSLMTRHEVGHWRDSTTLWSRAIAVTDNNYVAHTNLAVELAGRGDHAEAEAHYRLALRMRPDWSTAHNGVGVLLAARGDTVGAIAAYQAAIAARPGYAIAHRNLANQLSAQGRSDDALRHYRRALALRPDDAKAHLLLGLELARRGAVSAARPHFEQGARLNPRLRDAHYYAGVAAAEAGELAAAAGHFRAALQVVPTDQAAQAALDEVTVAGRAAPGARSASIAE